MSYFSIQHSEFAPSRPSERDDTAPHVRRSPNAFLSSDIARSGLAINPPCGSSWQRRPGGGSTLFDAAAFPGNGGEICLPCAGVRKIISPSQPADLRVDGRENAL